MIAQAPRLDRTCRLRRLVVLSLGVGAVSLGSTACGETTIEAARLPTPTGGAVSLGGEGSGGTTASGASTPGGAAGAPLTEVEWKLVWSDEFDVDGLPSSDNWTFEDRRPGWVNEEATNYPGPRLENARVESGVLIIEARRDDFDGYEYSSARIHSSRKAAFTYGRFEIRAKLPTGLGTWPAIWMAPDHPFVYATTCDESTGWIDGCDAWPNSGEIDIVEHVGHDVGNVHATIHCKAYNWTSMNQRTSAHALDDVTAFHVYALERRPDRIDGFVDDTRYFTFENEGTGWETWPFDQPFHFILNIAVGGTWGGLEGIDPDAFPQQMQIDYVRAYERTVD